MQYLKKVTVFYQEIVSRQTTHNTFNATGSIALHSSKSHTYSIPQKKQQQEYLPTAVLLCAV